MDQQDLNFMNQKFICADCGRTHIFSNDEKFIRCECGNVIIKPKFQTQEKILKKDKRSLNKSITIIFTYIFIFPIIYVISFWFIGFLFAITGWNGKSIRGWFFAENVDALRSSFPLEWMCHPIFFILLMIGFTIFGFSEVVKNEKIKSFFCTIGGIIILIVVYINN
jgi:ribosomal protein S27E